MQRRIALCIPVVDVGSSFNKLFQNIRFGVQTSQVYGRLSMFVLGIDVLVPAFDHLGHHRVVAVLRSPMQQILLPVAPDVVRRWSTLADGLQPRYQPIGRLPVVFDQRVQPVDGHVVVDRKEGIISVPADLIVDYLVLEQHRQDEITLGGGTFSHHEDAIAALCNRNEMKRINLWT